MINLYCPQGYTQLTKEQKKEICNGCGSKEGWLTKIIFGGKFVECCNIHDYMYSIGLSQEDKDIADRVFYNNMNRVIATIDNKTLKYYYKVKAHIFYKSVKTFGESAFWSSEKVMPDMVAYSVHIG